MKLAILYDAQRLREGGPALARLAVALLDEGIHLLRVVPDDFDPLRSDANERSIALVPRATYAAHVPWWLRIARRERLLDVFEREPPDVLYACGAGTWSLAESCAKALDCPLVVEVAGSEELYRLRDHRSLRTSAGTILLRSSPDVETSSTPTQAELALSQATAGLNPTVVRPGVASRFERQHEPLRSGGALRRPGGPSIAIVGPCTGVEWWRSLIEALRTLDVRLPDWHAVVELRGPAEHLLWRLLRESSLLARVSTVSDAEAVGPLVRRCDVLLLAEPVRRVSLPLLESMAAGMPVIAMADEWLPVLDGRTGIVLRRASPRGGAAADAWRQALEEICSNPSRAHAMGSAAAGYVARFHRTSTQASALADLFQRLASGPSLPFPGPSAPA